MKKFMKILGILLGIIVLIVAGLATWVNFSDSPTYLVQTIDVKLPTDSLSLATGKKITETICAYCHRSDNGTFDGRQFTKSDYALGEHWSANITHHPNGLDRYSNSELVYLLRSGVKRDGKMASPFMLFPNMSDQDMASLIAYLRSDIPAAQASDEIRSSKPSFLMKALFKFGAIKPFPYKGEPVIAPSPSQQVAYGRYLATAVYACGECHSASFETYDFTKPENTPGYFGGGNLIEDPSFGAVLSRNITPHREHGIGAWTETDFLKAMKAGIRPDGTALNMVMPRYSILDDAEINAIWAYLQTVTALGEPISMAVK